MTASEIVQVATTVAMVQLICDLIANWRIFHREPYQRALGALSKAKGKVTVLKQSAEKEGVVAAATTTTTTAGKKRGGGKSDKLAKRLQRAEEDYDEAVGNVAKKHTAPSIMTSLVFVILLRILGLEHKGKILGILPFAPFKFLRRITQRGLEFNPDLEFEPPAGNTKITDMSQAASFLFIYFLCTFSIKFYTHKLVGTKAPAGADSFTSILETPQSKKMLRSMGVDPNELKME